MQATDRLDETVRCLVRQGFRHEFGKPSQAAPPNAAWRALRATGTTLWLDTGDLDEAARLWNAEFSALTTNNTLLNREVQKGLYDELIGLAAAQIRRAEPAIGSARLVLEVAFVLNARHGLRLVERFDACVSVEIHTDLANDVDRSVAYGRRYHAICPERFIVKVPLSAAGLLAARRLADAGVPVNFTLGFSARQNVLAALLARPLYGNVFMGRLNAFVAEHQLGDGRNVGEKATLAAQRALLGLRTAGRAATRLIGASMRDGSQVATLAGVDVFTMPPKVAAQYAANPAPTLTTRVADDPPVTTAPGVELADFAAATLWEVPASFMACAEALGHADPGQLTPTAVVERLRQAGHGDLFPEWTADDIRTVVADGKIPAYATWHERLRTGAVGLDALMNLSALYSFAADQAALDARITRLLA